MAKEPDTHKKESPFGRDIAFGTQQTLACWATDIIDPPVSKWAQNRFGDKNHVVSDTEVWGGELVGDSAALFAFLAEKSLLRTPIEWLTTGVKMSPHRCLACSASAT